MSYRGVNQQRQQLQTTEIIRQAGFTATWRQFISASAGVSVAGFGSAVSYREQVVTAILGGQMGSVVTPNTQRQTPMGQLADGSLRIVTREQLGDKDEIIWRGIRFRVDANSQPSILNGHWMSTLNRGDN